ncbi:MAG TPA: PPC domain-containing DNA-binding protein [Lacunisphaera sp.]|jgi:predicted DNA-binding protein with PD1-like motif|nr:PPC domain-containing DNA-binding protein [Lacunisphaera sp.]
MKSQLLNRDGGPTHALIFATGDEVIAGLTQFAQRENLHAGHFTAIGAFSSAILAYFDWEKKDYLHLPVDEQVEVLVLAGDIAWNDGRATVHAHAVLGRRDGSTRGGHLLRGLVRPTLEVMLLTGGALEKRPDPVSGLALIAPR